jgi:flagellar biosynthesis protein FlhF
VKIKRYIAASMRVALDQVRIEQGPDAVILSSRRVDEGIEVIAAVDYDEALIAGAARQYSLTVAAAAGTPEAPQAEIARRPSAARASNAERVAAPRAAAGNQPARTATTATTRPAAPLAATEIPAAAVLSAARSAGAQSGSAMSAAAWPAPARVAVGAPTMTASAMTRPASGRSAAETAKVSSSERRASGASDTAGETPAGYSSVEREIKDLRKMLESEMANFSWNERRRREPLKTRVLEDLSAMDIAPDVAATLAARTPSRTSLNDTSKIPLALLLRHIPVVDDLSTVNAGVYAIVGPTGAGKTTTIAKLAARWTMKHGSQGLALVSTDSYRIGAREQLMTYARILGASMHAPNSGRELARVLERLKSKQLVLIDTAGMGPRDVRLPEQIESLKAGAAHAKYMLALPAQGEGRALEEIIRAFAPLSPSACILTKVDEAGSLGAVISTTLRHRLKIAYLCNGQRVPEDLHSAHRHRVWLVRAAHQLKEKAPAQRDDAYFARHFGRGHAHA